MIAPLRTGDKICLVAPGRKVSSIDMNEAIRVFESWGFEVVTGRNLFGNTHAYLSGNDQERRSDFQTALDDQSIKAIICARGGYGSSRIIDQLDFTNFKNNPKWIIGFSDITCFHLLCSKLEVPSIHGAMPIQFSKKEAFESIESLRNILFGGDMYMNAPPNKSNSRGEVVAPLVGGNLSLLVDSLGTGNELHTAGRILLVEEIDEPRYKVDRMFMQLKRAGKLDHLAGIGIGQMTEIGDSSLPFEETIEEIVLSKIESQIPIGFNLPFGHEHPNLAWIQGKEARLIVNDSGTVVRT